MRGFFITGTDTDCGKTRVAHALIHALRAQELKIAPFKPVAAGAQWLEVGLRNDDALSLMSAAESNYPYDLVNPYCYEAPIAPHLAAAAMGEKIDLQQILQNAKKLSTLADLLLVEGAGGWLVPLGKDIDMADMAAALQMPVVLVVGIRLGCLNHARLTEAMIVQRGLRLAGWIGSLLEPEMSQQEENIESLHALLGSPCLGIVPYLSESETGAGSIDVDSLMLSLQQKSKGI